jgi:hypothetical protein
MKKPVVVTTLHKGVFFGYAENIGPDSMHIEKCRNAVFWSEDVKGVVGLASNGPSEKCRIGPAADAVIYSITSVFFCTPKATEAWEAEPWGT